MTMSLNGIRPVVAASSDPSYYGNENPNSHFNSFNEELKQRFSNYQQAEHKLQIMRESTDYMELYNRQRN